MEAHANEVISRREAIAGRSLTASEIFNGIDHEDDMSERDKVYANAWQPVPVPASEPEQDGNPWREELAKQQKAERYDKMSTRAQMFADKADEYDAEKSAAEAKANFDSDPRRRKAIAHAESILESVMFAPDAKQSDVIKARQLVRQSREGDLSTYKAMSDEYAANVDASKAAKLAELDKQRAAIDAERAKIAGAKFEDEPKPKQEPSGYFYTDERSDAARRDFYERHWAAQRKQQGG